LLGDFISCRKKLNAITLLRMTNESWVVHKFGGTSVGSVAGYQSAAKIIIDDSKRLPDSRQAVVVSAMSGVTNKLIELVEQAKSKNDAFMTGLQDLLNKHVTTLKTLTDEKQAQEFSALIKKDIQDISDILKSVKVTGTFTPSTIEIVSGYGEVWSAQILSRYFTFVNHPTEWLDARTVLTIVKNDSGPSVDWKHSQNRIDPWLKAAKPFPFLVITGYVGSTADGVHTTLGRNGSDFSASIFAKLLKASWITIWTDVNGVLSADPRKVPDAFVLDTLSYAEATELAFFGAKVIHPKTILPAIEEKIPVSIRNTFNPTHPGTVIQSENPKNSDQHPIKGIATIDEVALLNLEGTGMLGVPGVASRLFGALKEVGVSVIMISQASSEQSICFVIPGSQGNLAKETVEKVFFAEFHHKLFQKIDLIYPCTVLAAVGDSMVAHKGIAARFFSSLASAGVNIKAIAQGSSERNISVVIDHKDSNKGLRAAHSGFYLSNQTLSVGLIGSGLIGSTFLKQLSGELKKLKADFHVDVRIRGITSSQKMLLDDQGIGLDNWQAKLETAETANLKKFVDFIDADYFPHSVIIDCTASDEIALQYTHWLERGIHIVTPNKRANSSSQIYYSQIKNLSLQKGGRYLYETTVGAALPIISTIRDLVNTGDHIHKIEGILSGTLSYIFNNMASGAAFSDIVMQAKKMGFTEPDPRDDLSGKDFGRKLVILARECGLKLELDQVQIESLVPTELQKVSLDEFLKRLPEFDKQLAAKLDNAKKSNKILRYVGLIEGGKARVQLIELSAEHPFAGLKGTDNVIAFTTDRYSKNPLIVQGPGAGPDVTAGGVFADLLRLASYLGAPS
jgi:aspartokinase/homoserine dehydrogenase 1